MAVASANIKWEVTYLTDQQSQQKNEINWNLPGDSVL